MVIVCNAAAADKDCSFYKFMVLGDVHYADAQYYAAPDLQKRKSIEKYVGMWAFHSRDLLAAAGRCASRESVSLVIQLGDLTNGECGTAKLHEQMFRDAFRTVKEFFPGKPLYAVKGNHDVWQQYGESSAPADKILLPLVAGELGRKELRNGNYAFRKGRDLFIAIDCFTKDETCLSFISRILLQNPDTRYVFLLTHYPLFPAAVNSPLCLIPDYDQISRLLEKRKALILAAHTHAFSIVSRTTNRGN